MNKYIQIKSMLRVDGEFMMTLLKTLKNFFKTSVKRALFILNFPARRTLKGLINKLDTLESESKKSQKINSLVSSFLTLYISKSLKRKWIGYKYRTEEIKPGYPEAKVLKELERQAEIWKRGESYFQSARLEPEELDKLHQIAEYTEFAELLINYKKLAREMFEWALRDNNEIAPYIEFPNTASKLIECHLSERIGRMDEKVLKIKKGHSKILTLPFEGVDHNILNPDYIVDFSYGLRLSVANAFEIFKNKAFDSGKLEFMKMGIINWNALLMGHYNAETKKIESIDVNVKRWWERLPLFKTLTLEKVIQRYGVVPHAGEWIASASSTRGNLNLDFNNTHAFLEVAIPTGKGTYNLFDFGKFASIFPKNFLDAIKMLCKNSHASIAYPDENVYYTHRETALKSFILDEIQAEQLMDSIKEDILASRSTNFVYQIESENCAKWVEHKLHDALGSYNIPHLFWMPLLDTEPNGLVKTIFSLIKKLPSSFQVPMLACLHLPLGAFQETLIEEEGLIVAKSLRKHDFFEHGHVYLPALLNEKKKEEEERQVLILERSLWVTKERIYEWMLKIQKLLKSFKTILSYFTPPPLIDLS